jgi:hypothetical protein
MPRGIRGINEWTFGKEFGQETDPHSQVMASYMTAAPVDRTSTDAQGNFSFDKLNAMPFGRSMDHFIADQLNAPGVGPLIAHIGGTKTDSISTMSYSAPLEKYNGVGTPAQLFANLTNLGNEAMMGGEVSADTYKVARGQSVIDIIRADLDSIERLKMSQSDKDKLNHWKDLLHDTTGVMRSAMCTTESADALGISQASVDAARNLNGDLVAVTPIMMDLLVLNALCDQNRFMMLFFPGNMRMGFIDGVDGNTDNHGISHRIGNANMGGECINGVNDMIEKIDTWYAEQFAYLVGKMDSISHGDGTLLDNSATLWLQEQSDGQAHNLNNLPIVHAGSAGGYFKTGMAINVDDGAADLMGGNSLGQCGAGDNEIGGNEVQSTGTPNDLANAPFNKYMYNLMNALGVKANADGFPEVGGTEKVRKFGWSDDPKKFASFNPSNSFESQEGGFIDEGEFEDLLA